VTAGPLAAVVRELRRAGIPHMLAGSFASSYHGDPRTTQDIDLVIDPTRAALERFVDGLDPHRFYVSREAATAAFERRGQFNVVMLDSGWKVDLIVRKERPFSRSEFERRQTVEVAGIEVPIASAEDTVVAKLEWAQRGESERQLRDVVGILQLSGESLDRAYIERFVAELGLEPLWARALAAAADRGDGVE
jgi:hypothetical protein